MTQQSTQDDNHQTEENRNRSNEHPVVSHSSFSIIRQIAGINWKGQCRYVKNDANSNKNSFSPNSAFILNGGMRLDVNETGIQITSFIEFPNGKVREVVMYGEKEKNAQQEQQHQGSIDLYPVGTSSNGPIYMRITELSPDTILFHELERSTDKVVLTGSISVAQAIGRGSDHDKEIGSPEELVQVSHELGDTNDDCVIKGHQVWRYKNI